MAGCGQPNGTRRHACALTAGFSVAHGWSASVLALAGHPPWTTLWLAVPCAIFVSALALDSYLTRWVRGSRPAGPAEGGIFGGCLGAACAGFAISEVGEPVMTAGNIGDMALAALLLGVPAGTGAVIVFSRILVDIGDSDG